MGSACSRGNEVKYADPSATTSAAPTTQQGGATAASPPARAKAVKRSSGDWETAPTKHETPTGDKTVAGADTQTDKDSGLSTKEKEQDEINAHLNASHTVPTTKDAAPPPVITTATNPASFASVLSPESQTALLLLNATLAELAETQALQAHTHAHTQQPVDKHHAKQYHSWRNKALQNEIDEDVLVHIIMDSLRHTELAECLSDQELLALARLVDVSKVDEHAIIYKQGALADQLHIVHSGTVLLEVSCTEAESRAEGATDSTDTFAQVAQGSHTGQPPSALTNPSAAAGGGGGGALLDVPSTGAGGSKKGSPDTSPNTPARSVAPSTSSRPAASAAGPSPVLTGQGGHSLITGPQEDPLFLTKPKGRTSVRLTADQGAAIRNLTNGAHHTTGSASSNTSPRSRRASLKDQLQFPPSRLDIPPSPFGATSVNQSTNQSLHTPLSPNQPKASLHLSAVDAEYPETSNLALTPVSSSFQPANGPHTYVTTTFDAAHPIPPLWNPYTEELPSSLYIGLKTRHCVFGQELILPSSSDEKKTSTRPSIISTTNSLTGASNTGAPIIYRCTAHAHSNVILLSLSRARLDTFFTQFSSAYHLLKNVLGDFQERSMHRLPWLTHFPAKPLSLFSLMFNRVHIPSNVLLFQEGEVAQDDSLFYFIMDGMVELTTMEEKGGRSTRQIGAGEMLDENGFLLDLPYTGQAVTRTPCTFRAIPRKFAIQFLRMFPSLTSQIRTRQHLLDASHLKDEMLLSSHAVQYAYKEFSHIEYNAENVEFWTLSRKFRLNYRTNQPYEMLQDALFLYTNYVSTSASQQINLQGRTRKYIQEQVTAPSTHADLFIDAENEIFHLMVTDSFQRFKGNAFSLFTKGLRKMFPPVHQSAVLSRESGMDELIQAVNQAGKNLMLLDTSPQHTNGPSNKSSNNTTTNNTAAGNNNNSNNNNAGGNNTNTGHARQASKNGPSSGNHLLQPGDKRGSLSQSRPSASASSNTSASNSIPSTSNTSASNFESTTLRHETSTQIHETYSPHSAGNISKRVPVTAQ